MVKQSTSHALLPSPQQDPPSAPASLPVMLTICISHAFFTPVIALDPRMVNMRQHAGQVV